MVLVTGGAGLVGKTLIDTLLKNGETVKAIYNQSKIPITETPHFHQIQCSILDVAGLQDALQNVDEVYHCAGLVSFNKKDTHKLFKINVEGTANMVNTALTAAVKKLVHVSSVAALGRIRENETINETMNWSPATSNSKYGHSKYLGELEVWRGMEEGLNAVIVNPTIIIGPGSWNRGSTAIFKWVYNQFPWYSTGTTGFADVRDVAGAMIALMKSSIAAERFILSGHNESYQAVFNLIADTFHKKRPSKKVTPFLANLVALIESIKATITGKEALVTKETAATAMAKANFDNSKLQNFLPDFQYRSLEETVKYTCDELLNLYATNKNIKGPV